MQLDWAELLAGHDGWVLVANLPYNVATPLICDLLDDVPAIARMLVMVQREAAERFAASPRTSAYGAVSVKAAYWGTAKVVGHVPASVFVPRPNVESALVAITRREPPATDPRCCSHWCGPGFGQRRKMLRRSLAGIVAPDTYDVAGISPTARPEELDVDAWCRLTDAHLAAGAGLEIEGSVTAAPTAAPPRSPVTVRAHAKLTLGLRITGVRDDGYHLIDAEMVSLDLHDLITLTPGGHGLTPPGRSPTASRSTTPTSSLVRCASPGGDDERRRASRQADSPRRRPRRRLDRRGHGAALVRLRPRRPASWNERRCSAPTSRSASSAVGPGSAASASTSSRSSTSTAPSHW